MRYSREWRRARQVLPPALHGTLTELLRQYRIIGVILACELAALVFLAVALLAISADWLIVLPKAWRYVLRDAAALASLLLLAAVLAMRLRPLTPARWALHVETLIPGIKGRLATAAELAARHDAAPQSGASPRSASAPGQVLEFISAQAERVIAAQPGIELSLRVLKTPAFVVAGLAAILLAWWVVSGSRFERAFARFLLPGSGIPAPTQLTIVDVRPGSVTIRRGGRIETSCAVRGGTPDKVELVLRSGADEIRTSALLSEDRFSAVSPPLDRSVTYFFEIPGKTKSDEYLVRALAPARVTSVRFTITPPAYTKREPYEMSDEPVIIEGSRVEVVAYTDRAASGGFLFLDNEKIAMNVVTGGLAASFSADKPCSSYTVAFTDADGFPSEDRPRRPIAIKADRPPEVRIVSPADGSSVKPRTEIPVAVEVYDDYRVEGVHLAVTTADDAGTVPALPKEQPRLRLDAAPQPNVFAGAVPVEFLPAQKGSVTLAAVAVDNCPYRFQQVRGPEVKVFVSETAGAPRTAAAPAPETQRLIDLLDNIDQLAAARQRADEKARAEIDRTMASAAAELRSAAAALEPVNPAAASALSDVARLAQANAPYPLLSQAIVRAKTLLEPQTRPLAPEAGTDIRPSPERGQRPSTPPPARKVEELPDPPDLSPAYRRLMKIYRKLLSASEQQ